MRLLSIGVLCISMFMLAVASAARPTNAELKKQVTEHERAFAATMKARDHAAFQFPGRGGGVLSGPGSVLRGREAVATAWKNTTTARRRRFSWEPEEVEVVESGTLAYSGGPVYDAAAS
jgi:ketosteroid isomerase-like protein